MRSFILTLGLFVFALGFSPKVFAQSPHTYTTGTVTAIIEEQEFTDNERSQYAQVVEIQRSDSGENVSIAIGSKFQPLDANQRLEVGRKVVVERQVTDQGTEEWVLADTAYRIPTLLFLFGVFAVLVLLIARVQGALSMLGMGISFAILMFFIIPQIISGANPILISIISAVVIGACSIYLSHGFSRKSHIAYASIILTLTCVAILSSVVMKFASMSGLGSEEAVFLQVDPSIKVNIQGLLLAGIVLGALGILDDICISQVSIVNELIKAKPHITTSEVFVRGLAVGKDHIASLVNTLVLAYAGASLPLFLLFSLNNTRPLWIVLNDEMIAEEIVRTLTGSIGLVLAVPLTTILASLFLTNFKSKR